MIYCKNMRVCRLSKKYLSALECSLAIETQSVTEVAINFRTSLVLCDINLIVGSWVADR